MPRALAIAIIIAAAVAAYFVGSSMFNQARTPGLIDPAAPNSSVIPGAPNAVHAPDAAPSTPAKSPPPARGTVPGATIIPSKLEVQADGSTLADGKWTFHGDGSKENPFELNWDYLMSAGDTFIPRLGERLIPERIAMMQGQWVRISGYVAFPLIATESDELLCMLNQWDGCCIGVPPTPYDAIEVALTSAVDSSKRHTIRYGTVTGILRIEPYIVEKWLIGLYLMDEANLHTEM
ncbi:MAG: hypothetical protein EXS00_04240 [Phycisphaerales bacterium]|nr:hypothetical protein [Phycisphaerales bacterium]